MIPATVFNRYKTETFLVLSILSSLLFSTLPMVHFISALFILKLVLRNKPFIFLSVLLLASALLSEYSLLIIDKYDNSGKLNSYRTSKGVYKTDTVLSTGTMVFGAFNTEDRRYYNIITDNSSTADIPLPVIGNILKLRNNYSEQLFYLSGGKLTLPQALLMGNKSYLSTDIKDQFTILGLNHLLAVSGMHVGLILLIMYSFTIQIPQKVRFLILVTLLILFAPLAGLKIPVLRAVFFSAVIMTALFFDTKTDIKKLLLFTAGFFILLSPSTITDASFILSFSAVFGIISLMNKGYGKLFSLLTVGFIATAFTLPAVLYMFGTFNILSIINTIIVLPFIYLILTTSLFGLFFTELSIAPLLFLQDMTKNVVTLLVKFTDFAFVLHKVDISTVLIIIFILAASVYFKRIWIMALVFIIPFLPANTQDGIYVPNLIRSKCFILKSESNHIFYQGQYSDFKYKVLPFIAELGINKFDTGQIRIYGGKNNFIKIDTPAKSVENICINENKDHCNIVFMTKSNSLHKSNIDNRKKYIIYKNRIEAENIYQLSKTGKIFINEGQFHYDHKD